jgi:hypothetical protein
MMQLKAELVEPSPSEHEGRCVGIVIGNMELAVVPLSDLSLHEEYDAKRAHLLAERIALDRLQRNPIILGRSNNGSLIHLDGATRIQALRQLKCPHAVAQIVNYRDDSSITLEVWSHVTRLDLATLQSVVRLFSGCRLDKVDSDEAGGGLSRRHFIAVVAFAKGDVFALTYEAPLRKRIELLKALSLSYEISATRTTIEEVAQRSRIEAIFADQPRANAVISFATFSKGDVIEAACGNGRLFPPGITRHVINCGRILNIDAPLELLHSAVALEKKQRQLEAMLATRHLRTYQESTIQFEY